MEAKQKAIEIVSFYENLPISFPYEDTQDGYCIGSGHMTHGSAIDCAKREVQQIMRVITPGLAHIYKYWQDVLTEIEKL